MSKFKVMPKVVCLCGSTRFKEVFEEMAAQETINGNVVLMPNVWLTAEEKEKVETGGLKDQLDELHKRKIDIADEILIINVGGYVGKSTQSEIDYAMKMGKPIRSLEPVSWRSG